tara:strand:- start:304 stop:468 length:165 start_codon:yes stop_codon:yes gene_type:complete
MTAKKNQNSEVVTDENVESEVVTDENVGPNEDGFIPGQAVTFEEVMATQRKKRS